MDSVLWVSKYQPKELSEVVLNSAYKARFENYIKNQFMNHCIFYGKPGTGKTTISLILKDSLIKNPYDTIFLNASNERGISVMRNTVLEFMKVPPAEGGLKLVIMDEADSLTPDAWKILRNPIENSEANIDLSTRFIFTANYISNIPDFIKSRCDCYEFGDIPRDFALDKCKYILSQENIEYDEEVLFKLFNSTYPDMRATINSLQKNSIQGKLQYLYASNSISEILKTFQRYVSFATEKQWDKAAELVYEMKNVIGTSEVDYISLTRNILNEYQLPIEMFPVINHYLNTYSSAIDKKAHFISMLGDSLITMKRVIR